MHPSDLPLGYTEHWRKIISVYPPVDTQTMAGVLGGGYTGSMPLLPTSREVRLNAEKGRIEIWERKIQTDQAATQSDILGRLQGISTQ